MDPLDAVKEATYTIFSHRGPSASGLTPKRELVASTSVTSVDVEEGGRGNLNRRRLSNERIQPHDEQFQTDRAIQTERASFLSNQELSVLWSPSFSCGLSTPPSSRTISPATSAQDIPSLSEFVQRPMTPVTDQDKESNVDQQETRTSTPDTSRRKSGGDVRKMAQRSHKSPKLSAKSKSDESVEAKAKKPHQETGKGEMLSGAQKFITDKAKGSPKKKREKMSNSEKSTSRLFLADRIPGSMQTHSAPTTPDIRPKDSFSFNNAQDSHQAEQQITTDNQGKTITAGAHTPNYENKRVATTPSIHSTFDASAHESSADVSLLRVIKDLHQDALPKVTGQPLHNQDPNELVDGGVRSKTKSPLELLDEFIECGSNLHSLQLSRYEAFYSLN